MLHEWNRRPNLSGRNMLYLCGSTTRDRHLDSQFLSTELIKLPTSPWLGSKRGSPEQSSNVARPVLLMTIARHIRSGQTTVSGGTGNSISKAPVLHMPRWVTIVVCQRLHVRSRGTAIHDGSAHRYQK